MKIEMELWHLITLLLAFFGCVGGFGKLLLSQVEKRWTERDGALNRTLSEHVTEERRTASAVSSLERDFLKWQAELPINYVRREDYVRGQSVIEAKLDALYSKLEVVQMKGTQHGS